MKSLSWQHTLVWFFCSITLIAITACQPEFTETPRPIAETTEPAPAIEEFSTTVAPTPTEALSSVILLTSPESDPGSASQIQAALNQMISEEEPVSLVQGHLSPEMITPAVKIVIGVGPNLNMVDLAKANPDVSFVVVDDPAALPSGNLSVIGDPVIERQHQFFMAGYLSALISEDYKAAALIPLNDEDSNAMIESFMVGAEFYCGVCNPLHPPYNDFPYWQMLSVENLTSGFEPVIDSLVNYGVEVFFIPDVLVSSELLSYVASFGLKVVSDGEPDMARNNWVGTVTVNKGEALIELWPQIISKSEGVKVPGGILLTDTDAGQVSEGRSRLFDEMAADLQAGLVSPVSVP